MDTSLTNDTDTAALAAAQALTPMIRAAADQIERDRRFPASLVDAMIDAGLFKLAVPKVFGGGEAAPLTFARIVEEIAQIDGSTGWNLMTANHCSMLSAYLPRAGVEGIFSDPRVSVAGTGFPAGRAMIVDGGYCVTGHWRYASGCMHATWLAGASVIYDGDTARREAGGKPESRWFCFPIADCRILDTWHVTGLRGSGSHDFTVEDLFVPEERTCSHGKGTALGYENSHDHPGPLYIFGVSFVTSTFPVLALGIAQGALDAFVEMVGEPGGTKSHLRDNALVHAEIGKAEAHLRAARTFVYETMEQGWESAVRTGDVSAEQRLSMRLAAQHGNVTAAQVVESLWYAAGAAAIYEGNPLERRFRDAHVAAQRIGPAIYGEVGRIRLTKES